MVRVLSSELEACSEAESEPLLLVETLLQHRYREVERDGTQRRPPCEAGADRDPRSGTILDRTATFVEPGDRTEIAEGTAANPQLLRQAQRERQFEGS